MGSNSFGKCFTITTWGESHGTAIGVVIDGCPAGVLLNEDMINADLQKRRPGYSPYTSPRKEPDRASIYSGVFEGRTTGAPISCIILNKNFDSRPYEKIKNLYRPGHANYTYYEKYGLYDYKGGGRASARETACRVMAGAVAKAYLTQISAIQFSTYLASIGDIKIQSFDTLSHQSPIFCPDSKQEAKMIKLLEKVKADGDSIGGKVGVLIHNLPVGLGNPVYEKIEACLGNAILSIPAVKGVHFGHEEACNMKGSSYQDAFTEEDGNIRTTTNNSGGTLGGISTGMPIQIMADVKPTSSIKKPIPTLTLDKNGATIQMEENAKHDPCIAIRAVPVVEAMCAITLADLSLSNRLSRL